MSENKIKAVATIKEEIFSDLIFNPNPYIITVDTYDKPICAYSLCRKSSDNTSAEFLLVKTLKNYDEFVEEVTNLSKYFSAEIHGSL